MSAVMVSPVIMEAHIQRLLVTVTHHSVQVDGPRTLAVVGSFHRLGALVAVPGEKIKWNVSSALSLVLLNRGLPDKMNEGMAHAPDISLQTNHGSVARPFNRQFTALPTDFIRSTLRPRQNGHHINRFIVLELCTLFGFCCDLNWCDTRQSYQYPSGLLHWHWDVYLKMLSRK